MVDPASAAIGVLAVLVLLAASAFFSSTEIAVFSLPPAEATADEVEGPRRAIARDLPRLPPTADAFEAMAAAGGRDGPFALVEADGVVTGHLSSADFARALSFQREFRVAA